MLGYLNLRSLISIIGSKFPLTTPIFTIQQQTSFNLELGTYNSFICMLHIYIYEFETYKRHTEVLGKGGEAWLCLDYSSSHFSPPTIKDGSQRKKQNIKLGQMRPMIDFFKKKMSIFATGLSFLSVAKQAKSPIQKQKKMIRHCWTWISETTQKEQRPRSHIRHINLTIAKPCF